MRLINILKRSNIYYWTDKPISVKLGDKLYQKVELEEDYLNRFKVIIEWQNCFIVVSAAPKRVFTNYNKAINFRDKYYPDGEIKQLFLLI